MAEVAAWWLATSLIGLIAWPALFLLLPALPDRGYTVARSAGLLVCGYLVWLLGTVRLVPNTRGGHMVLLLVLGFGALILAARLRPALVTFWRANRLVIVVGELLFLLALMFWAWIRAQNPSIDTTEKPMDFAFLNSILRSAYFPPADPWLTGYSISYYYFGYLIVAVLTHLTGVASAVGFNLALATLFALVALGAYGAGFNLWRSRHGTSATGAIVVGLTTAFLILGIGNLQGALDVVRSRDLGPPGLWQAIGVNNALTPYRSPTGLPTETWWWWHSTRVINSLNVQTDRSGQVLQVSDSRDYTITEFPFFSFLLGDLHPHVMALPFTLLAVALGLDAALTTKASTLAWPRRYPYRFGFAALVLGGLGFLNSWDLPTYLLVYLGGFGLALFRYRGWDWDSVKSFAVMAVGLATTAIFLYVPFYGSFQSQANGVLPWRGPSTQPQHFAIIWGPLLFLALSFLAIELLRASGRVRWTGTVFPIAAVACLPFLLWLVADLAAATVQDQNPALALQEGGERIIHVWPLLLFVGLATLALVLRASEWRSFTRTLGESPQDPTETGGHSFALLSLAIGCLLVLFTELFFIHDVFGNRMNTVFKFYYQAWTLFAVAGSYGLYCFVARLWRAGAGLRIGAMVWTGIAGLLIAAALVYPFAATPSKLADYRGEPTLDGLAFTRQSNPSDAAAIDWLTAHVAGQPVVAEATGGEYSEFGRVSERSGLPTILGWAGHENQWRGNGRSFVGRDRDLDALYGPDPSLIGPLVQRYRIGYIFYGTVELGKYPSPSFDRLPQLLEIAYHNEAVTIYHVKTANAGQAPL